MFNTLLQAAPAAQPQGSALMTFLPLILIVVVCYFMMIRPQQKKQKEEQKMRDALKKGDRVMTASGLKAKVSSVRDNEVVLEIAEGVKATFSKAAIIQVENGQASEKAEESK